ncbi:MAG: DUF881 domain-containing protein [Actinomycetota bacterium]|nr:DUF881 domain-containing protein [Actinomycetota bacterium]
MTGAPPYTPREGRPPGRGGPDGAPGPDPAASMSLLTSLMNDTLDPGYAEAVARRGGGASSQRSAVATLLVLVGTLVAGLVLSTAAVQVRARAGAAAQARERIVAEIRERTADLDRRQRDLDRLRGEVSAARQAALRASSGAPAAQRLVELESLTGLSPVRGPGLRITIDDAEGSTADGAAPRDSTATDDGRVLDYDLQRLVNGLWASGAEAVSVNGRRLTALTAIRLAGEAIVVDYRPLARPYVVDAVGDADTMEPAFVDSDDGRYLRVLTENYGVRLDISSRERLRLPGASGVTLRQARAGRPGDATVGEP